MVKSVVLNVKTITRNVAGDAYQVCSRSELSSYLFILLSSYPLSYLAPIHFKTYYCARLYNSSFSSSIQKLLLFPSFHNQVFTGSQKIQKICTMLIHNYANSQVTMIGCKLNCQIYIHSKQISIIEYSFISTSIPHIFFTCIYSHTHQRVTVIQRMGNQHKIKSIQITCSSIQGHKKDQNDTDFFFRKFDGQRTRER